MKNRYALIFLLSAGICHGQNLVPNPSFEEYEECPLFVGNFTVTNWNIPTGGSSDYFNTCSTEQLGIPQNVFGWQYPRTGNAYVGAHGSAPGGGDSREYIQCQLISFLEAGEQYEVSFWVSRADSSTFACDNIGAYLSSTPTSSIITTNLPFSPQIVSEFNNPITDAINWIQIVDTITAVGGEQYLIIGVFTDDTNTNMIPVSGGWQTVFHYYYDDVSVIKLASNSINEEIDKMNISIFPNPSNGKISIKSNEIIEGYVVYTSLGQIIINEDSDKLNNILIDFTTHTSGLYYLKLTTNKSTLIKKIIINN